MSERDRRRPPSPLEGERGSTTVNGSVVSTIVGVTAGEVPGIHMGSGTARAAGGFFGGVTGSRGRTTPGVSVEVGRVEVAIDLTVEIEYGRNILRTTEMVRDRVTERVEGLTGLRVTELNVTINDVIFPEGEGPSGGPGYEDLTWGLGAGGREREATDDTEPIEMGAREGTRDERELEGPGEDATTELRLGDEEIEPRRRRRRER